MSNALRAQGTQILHGGANTAVSPSIVSLTPSGSIVTVTTSTAHGLTTGAIITISGASPSGYNGTYAVTVLSATTFTYTPAAAVGPNGAVGSYTGQGFSFTAVEECTDIKVGGITVTSIDVTHLRSLAKEFIPGLSDNTTVDISCNFINGTIQNVVRADANAALISPYQIVIASGTSAAPSVTTIAFNGFVTKYAGPDAKVDNKLEIQITIKVTGALTITTV